MKVTYTVILALAYFSAALSLPYTSTRKINDDVEIIPLEKQTPIDPTIVDTGVFYNNFPTFNGLFENFNGIMTRMRQQMDQLLKQFNFRSNSTDGPSFPSFPQFGGIDLSKGNTTSVTKIIDGHKVVINETEYKKEDDFGGAFFKVRVVDVKPDSSEVTESGTEVVTEADREPLSSSENEIVKNKEALNTNNVESLEEVNKESTEQHIPNGNINWDDIETLDEIDDNSVLPGHDLSNDIYVNDVVDGAAPLDPDVEVFEITPRIQKTAKFEKITNAV